VRARVAVIGGSGLYGLDALEGAVTRAVATPFGAPSTDVRLGRVGDADVAFLARHGKEHTIPPHRVNHRANLWALRAVGAHRILGTSSVGSLKREIRPGTLVVPHDFLSLWDLPTFHDETVVHATPSLDETMRTSILSVLRGKTASRGRAVYAQTRGPRLETKAEIRLLKDYADVVGMTMASEATLAAEIGVPYASLCTADNYAHGITATTLTYGAIVKTQRENAKKVLRFLPSVIEALAREE